MKIISSQPFCCGKNGKPQPPLPPQGVDANRSDNTLSLKISCCNAARTMRGGDFSTLWRLCIESPSQPKLASSLHNKRLSYWRLTGFGRNDGGAGRRFYHLRSEISPLCSDRRNNSGPGVSVWFMHFFSASFGHEKRGSEEMRNTSPLPL